MKTRIRIQNESASGRRKGWTKLVTAVDTEKTDGWAFQGEFLKEGEHDLEVGSVVVQKNPEGSVKNGWNAGVCLVVEEGGLRRVHEKTYDWYEDFLSFRDLVASQLNQIASLPLAITFEVADDAEGQEVAKALKNVNPADEKLADVFRRVAEQIEEQCG